MPSRTVALLALLTADVAFAATTREVSWDDLSEFAGRTIQLVMPDAVSVTGKLEAVETQALLVTVRKSENQLKYRKGQRVQVPRDVVRTFEVQRNTKRWRIVGTSVGAFIGAVVAAGIELSGGLFTASRARDAAAISAWGGCAVGGFFLGRAADRRSFTVVIRPAGLRADRP